MNIFHKSILRLSLILLFILACIPVSSHAASLSISPSSGSVSVGETLTVKVVVNSEGVSLNAISGDLLFPLESFSIESSQKSNSILNFWVTEPSFSNQTGIGHFEGVSLTGYSGSGGTVMTYTLRAKKEGTGTISFKSGLVLANDGQGTDITKGLSGATYTITPAKVIEKKVKEEPKVIDTPQEPPTLTAPEIHVLNKYGEKSIVGISEYPHSKALITFVAPDGSKIFINANSDEKGGFNAPVPGSLKRGVYSVTAIMVKEDGSNSLVSEEINITIGSIFSDIGIEFYITILLLIMVIIYLICRLASRRRKGLPLVVLRKETREAEDVLKRSFEILKTDEKRVEQKLKLNSQKIKVEDLGLDDLKKDLKEAEDTIEKEIKDIDSV